MWIALRCEETGFFSFRVFKNKIWAENFKLCLKFGQKRRHPRRKHFTCSPSFHKRNTLLSFLNVDTRESNANADPMRRTSSSYPQVVGRKEPRLLFFFERWKQKSQQVIVSNWGNIRQIRTPWRFSRGSRSPQTLESDLQPWLGSKQPALCLCCWGGLDSKSQGMGGGVLKGPLDPLVTLYLKALWLLAVELWLAGFPSARLGTERENILKIINPNPLSRRENLWHCPFSFLKANWGPISPLSTKGSVSS